VGWAMLMELPMVLSWIRVGRAQQSVVEVAALVVEVAYLQHTLPTQ
jgi:hypothetical protein